MKVLVHGMQSGGTTLLALLLAQIQESICVLDLFSPHMAPELRVNPSVTTIVKTTVAKRVVDPRSIREDETVLAAIERGQLPEQMILPGDPLTHHIAAFRPDITILLLRNPADIITSMHRKRYGATHPISGSLEDKLRLYEHRYTHRQNFDVVCRFEDMIEHGDHVRRDLASSGLELPPAAWRFERPVDNIVEYARTQSSWCNKFFGLRWGTGNASPMVSRTRSRVSPTDRHIADAMSFCPEISALYGL